MRAIDSDLTEKAIVLLEPGIPSKQFKFPTRETFLKNHDTAMIVAIHMKFSSSTFDGPKTSRELFSRKA